MAGKREPTALVLAKGKKHLTKAEIALREAQELHPDADKVAPPAWLDKVQKRRFKELAAQLIELKIMTNLDCEALDKDVTTQRIDPVDAVIDAWKVAMCGDVAQSTEEVVGEWLKMYEKHKKVSTTE